MTPTQSRFARSLPLAALLALSLPLAAPAGTFEVTGANGGTVDGSWDCAWLDGAWTCNSQSLITAADGRTGTRQRTTTLSAGMGATTVTGTRVTGQDFTRSRTWSR